MCLEVGGGVARRMEGGGAMQMRQDKEGGGRAIFILKNILKRRNDYWLCAARCPVTS